MDHLARVFLEVYLPDANALFPFAQLDLHPPVQAEGRSELGDLVVLGKVGVEVVLPFKDAGGCKGTVQRPGHDTCHPHGLGIQGGKHAGISHADRADIRIRFIAEGRPAAAEDLRPGEKLGVHLQAQERRVHSYLHPVGKPGASGEGNVFST